VLGFPTWKDRKNQLQRSGGDVKNDRSDAASYSPEDLSNSQNDVEDSPSEPDGDEGDDDCLNHARPPSSGSMGGANATTGDHGCGHEKTGGFPPVFLIAYPASDFRFRLFGGGGDSSGSSSPCGDLGFPLKNSRSLTCKTSSPETVPSDF